MARFSQLLGRLLGMAGRKQARRRAYRSEVLVGKLQLVARERDEKRRKSTR